MIGVPTRGFPKTTTLVSRSSRLLAAAAAPWSKTANSSIPLDSSRPVSRETVSSTGHGLGFVTTSVLRDGRRVQRELLPLRGAHLLGDAPLHPPRGDERGGHHHRHPEVDDPRRLREVVL